MLLLPQLHRVSRLTRQIPGLNSHNTSNHYSFSRFYFVSNPGNTNKKGPLSEEEKRKRKENKAEYDRIRNAKPEIKAKRKEYDRIRYENPGTVNKKEPLIEEEKNMIERKRKERKVEKNRIRNAKPEIKAKRKEYNRIRSANPENKEKRREYEANNKERIREVMRRYVANNKERLREAKRRYDANNKEKRLQAKHRRYIRKMKKINPNYVYNPRKKPEYDWKSKYSTKSFFEKVGKKLKIVKKSDWYHVSMAQIRENGGSGVIARHGYLGFALKFAYPHYPWDMERFQNKMKLAAQRWLRIKLEALLPKGVVLESNFSQDPSLYDLEGSTSNYPSQYDFFIKEWRLAIEYQGEQHYIDLRPIKSPLSERQKKDAAKLASAIKHNIILVLIPYWWDRTSESLSSTLHQYMPDKFPKTDSPPIPTELPLDYQKIKTGFTPNKKIMMGYDLDTSVDETEVKGWFMSEKFDGIRAYWDGKGNFWSKNGKIINVPESFKQLPSFPLDGELWGGYDENQSLLAFLKSRCGLSPKETKKTMEEWEKVKFCVFDAPDEEGSYDKRHLFLKNNLTQYCNSNISLISMQKCEGKEHLQQYLDEIIKKGGEGIMIYNPHLPYQTGRCHNVLKVKKFYESTITFLELSKKSLSFKCKHNNGSEVWLKVKGGYYMRPPKVGSEIPVRHQGFFANSQNFKYPVLYEPESTKPKRIQKKRGNETTKKATIETKKKQPNKQPKKSHINIE